MKVLAAIFLMLAFFALPAQARDRPGTPNKGFAGNCGNPLIAEPEMCVEFMNTASERVGFLMDWTENGTHMNSDLRGRSQCITRSAQSYWCTALQWWFSGNTNKNPVSNARYNSQREFPEAFRIQGLLWDTEYCFRFRAMDEDGVISALWSGYTCAHTPPAPGAPGALDPPKLTGIRGTSGEGAIGGATPFKLLVEWKSSRQSSSGLGWYSIELWGGRQWQEIATLDPVRASDAANLELAISRAEFGNGDARQSVRVCAHNIANRVCSREAWYYGSLKPKGAATLAEHDRRVLPGPGANATTTAEASNARVLVPQGRVASSANVTARPKDYASITGATPPPPFIPGAAPAATAFYSIDGAGVFTRYTHTVPETGTVPTATVAATQGWETYRDVIPAGGNHFYARTANGDLLWFEHNPLLDPAAAWKGPIVVARGWQQFTQIIGGGNGVIYAIAPDGAIVWYRHAGFATGNPNEWSPPNALAHDWGNFKAIFASGDGVIYTVTQDNRLMANRHLDPINGAAAWSKPVQVGNGWGGFAQLFSTGNGVIYGLTTDGKLSYYRHLTWNAATPTFKWVGPVAAGEGFDPAAKIVPVLP